MEATNALKIVAYAGKETTNKIKSLNLLYSWRKWHIKFPVCCSHCTIFRWPGTTGYGRKSTTQHAW